jgi:hypothetical protein
VPSSRAESLRVDPPAAPSWFVVPEVPALVDTQVFLPVGGWIGPPEVWPSGGAVTTIE